jgi:transposase, IS5 family
MRRKRDPQQNLLYLMARNKVARELEAISLVLDQNPGILDLVFRDLVKYQRTDTGRGGMTAEQVLRGAILKQYRELTYEELAFHLEDSMAFRSFARLDMGQYPCGSTLQDNIKDIQAETWEAVNRVLLEYAAQQKVEKGRAVRMDSTVVETHIHHPTDLVDGRHSGDHPSASGRQGPEPYAVVHFCGSSTGGQETGFADS